ncbi:single-stranded-DNA-specific exonuclease RecJ [Rhodothermus sp. AH-315-K08]|nr:single-stranded-DNA-specific exonuclease RecJ [Rhodothermus sp. AH-315-K08]
MEEFDWAIRPVGSLEEIAELGKALNDLPDALARALYLRDVQTLEEAKLYFRGGLDATPDAMLMADMPEACARLQSAISGRERVVVYGDYDVDGTTSTAMVTHFLRSRGVPAAYFIPDRFKHGYGLCKAGLDEALELGASLVIAIDCGVTAVEEAQYARDLGLDLIICDHHTPPSVLPVAVAVLDPKRSDCPYPFKELCGCGVAFKLLQAVVKSLGLSPSVLDQYLDLVALATASDVVPLLGENRILLREGLKRLQTEPRLGIRMMAEEANVLLESCDTRAIQFNLAPRINAAGRLGDAKRAVKLLLTDDEAEASERARQLEKVNRERRTVDQLVLAQASDLAEKQLEEEGRASIVLYDPGWHIGVVGIVASRLVDRFNRPAVLLGQVNGVAKGSARSIPGVNIYNALAACKDLLKTFGGHDYAAGLALDPNLLESFQKRFDTAVASAATSESFRKALDIDAEVNLSEITNRFWAVLQQFGPFGQDNDRPVFVARNLAVPFRPTLVGRTQDHVKFRVQHGDSPPMNVIGFRLASRFDLISEVAREGSKLDLAFTVSLNQWNGVRTLQLEAKGVKRSSLSLHDRTSILEDHVTATSSD